MKGILWPDGWQRAGRPWLALVLDLNLEARLLLEAALLQQLEARLLLEAALLRGLVVDGGHCGAEKK